MRRTPWAGSSCMPMTSDASIRSSSATGARVDAVEVGGTDEHDRECRRRRRGKRRRRSGQGRRRRPWRRRRWGAWRVRSVAWAAQPTSTTTRSRYQPHDPHTVCGTLAEPQRGHRLRGGVRQPPRRSPDGCGSSTSMSSSSERPSFAFLVHVTADPGVAVRSCTGRRFGSPVPQGPHHVIGPRPVHIRSTGAIVIGRRLSRSSETVERRPAWVGHLVSQSHGSSLRSTPQRAQAGTVRPAEPFVVECEQRHLADQRVRSSWPSSIRKASGSITSSGTARRRRPSRARQRREAAATHARPRRAIVPPHRDAVVRALRGRVQVDVAVERGVHHDRARSDAKSKSRTAPG